MLGFSWENAMSRDSRKQLIERLETLRESKVIVYVTGDRSPTPAQIGDDAIRPLFDHLRALGRVEKLDLFIYSRGGNIDVPWRIANALRTTAESWNILIPFRANSAATLLALGADSIVLGPQGELGPIDPILGLQRVTPDGQLSQEQINVEDVMSYQRFVSERAGLTDQAGLLAALEQLTGRMDAISIGNAYRTHSHIRDVARSMLGSRKAKLPEQTISTIVETLAERVYAHGHAISFNDAKTMGLPVEEPGEDLEPVMWELLGEYEDHLKLLEPLDPVSAIANSDHYVEDVVLSVIESTTRVSEYSGTLEVHAQRQMPQNLTVPVNLNLGLPPGQQLDNLSGDIQAVLQELVQQAQQAITQLANVQILEALNQQAPIVGAEVALRGLNWKSSD